MSELMPHEMDDLAILRQMVELTETELWQRALGAKPAPSTWRVYYTGELHEAPHILAQVTRELMRRKLALLSQRRAKKTGRKDPGFEYLILAVRRDAKVLSFAEKTDEQRDSDHSHPAIVVEPPAVPKSTGRKPSEQTKLILAAFDDCHDKAETARRVGLSPTAVYNALYQHARIGPRSKAGR